MAPAPSGSALAAGRLSRVLKIKKKKEKPSSLFNNPLPISTKAQMASPLRADAVHGTDPPQPGQPRLQTRPTQPSPGGVFLFLIPGPALPTRTAPAMENGKPCAAWLGTGRKEQWPAPRHGLRATSPTATVGWQRCRRGPSLPGGGACGSGRRAAGVPATHFQC